MDVIQGLLTVHINKAFVFFRKVRLVNVKNIEGKNIRETKTTIFKGEVCIGKIDIENQVLVLEAKKKVLLGVEARTEMVWILGMVGVRKNVD